jgi:hypothetical protein
MAFASGRQDPAFSLGVSPDGAESHQEVFPEVAPAPHAARRPVETAQADRPFTTTFSIASQKRSISSGVV